jgi:hypothetical protein
MGQVVKRGENGEITHIKVGNSFVDKKEHNIRVQLEDLVGSRFNKESLEKALSIIFDVDIVLDDISRDDDELGDYNFLGGFDIPEKELYGFFDIYFLKMRRPGFDNADIYVTEVAIEFE